MYTGKIRTFIVDTFLFGEMGGLTDESSFMDDGIVDSTGILELVNFLEEEFGITVQDEELIPENLGSIARVAHFLRLKNAPVPGIGDCGAARA